MQGIQVGLKPIRCLSLLITKGQCSSIVDGISEVFTSLCALVLAGLGLFKHSDEPLHILWSADHTCIDAMSAFSLGMMHPPGLEIHLTADKRVVSVTVCTLVTN